MVDVRYPSGLVHPKGLGYISETYKIIFIPIPKNASTSVRSIGNLEFRQGNFLAYKTRIANGEYKTFAILREPISRFVSGYIEVCKRATGDSTAILKRDFYWIKNPHKRFILFLDELESEWFDAHMFPQHYFLYDYEDKPYSVDAYIDMKCLDSALPVVLGRFGAPITKFSKQNQHGSVRVISPKEIKDKYLNFKNYQRSLYFIADATVRRINRRRLPDNKEIYEIVRSDKRLEQRIIKLYERDIELYRQAQEAWGRNKTGICWNRDSWTKPL